MYYWSKNVSNIILEEELHCVDKVTELYFGTAFFSNEGLRILKEVVKKNNLKRESVHVYISNEFSQDKPHELLQEICKIAQAKIFFNHTFHSKVYLLKGQTNKVVFGSSNLTMGGFSKNIEFDSIEEVEGEKLAELERFFNYCDFNSTEVNNDVINYYLDYQAEIEALNKAQKKLRKKIKGYIHQDDAMDSDDYDIDDFYFSFSDYETFFNRNAPRDDMDIREQRKIVQNKMLAIHDKVYSKIKKLGVNCHWNPKHVTSVIRPCVYNKGRVGWLGIRYGKTKKEVDILNQWLDYKEKDEIKGFQKHGCLQFCIVPKGFEINLFLAVRHDAIDRAYVQEKMDQLEPRITKEISKLQGYGMTWEIYNDATDEYHYFEIDNEEAEGFCKFIQKYDRDGFESYLKLFYPADDKALSNIDSISDEIINYITLLKPLYNAMVWRPKL
ncbi:MAG: phospholipase D family protein [Desulfitobacterium hafniense]|nr:phospholipase D family protein [Desulfitobacterium hafniense]